LGSFVGDDGTKRSLAVVDGGGPRVVRRALERLFENQSVGVRDDVPLDGPAEGDLVVLLDGGEVVASDPLSAVYRAILGVNTDLYTTGARGLEDADLPDVVSGLSGTTFRLRDYPTSEREKLLLVAVSRAIERRAFLGGGGKVRSSFQRLSRVEDERGTRSVYERLCERGLDVHLYGRPDWTPGPEFGATIHGGYTPDFTDSWFVVYDPEGDGEPAAMVALRRGREWAGRWTFDPERVRELVRYVEREL
jgi:hypothetical protein